MVTPDPSEIWPSLAYPFLQVGAFFGMKMATVMGTGYAGLCLLCMSCMYTLYIWVGVKLQGYE